MACHCPPCHPSVIGVKVMSPRPSLSACLPPPGYETFNSEVATGIATAIPQVPPRIWYGVTPTKRVRLSQYSKSRCAVVWPLVWSLVP